MLHKSLISAHYTALYINGEHHEKHLYTINPATTENMECVIGKASTPVIHQKIEYVLLDHGVSLRFVLIYFYHFG